MVVEYGHACTAGMGERTTSDFGDVLGRAPREIDNFVRDHAEVFA